MEIPPRNHESPRQSQRRRGIVRQYMERQMVVPAPSRPLVLRHERAEERAYPVVTHLDLPVRRGGTVLSQLVDAGQRLDFRLYPDNRRRLHHDDGRRYLYGSADKEHHDGRPLQQRKRIFHAGDPFAGERILREPADTFLFQEEVAQRMDQRGEPVPRVHRAWYTRFRQVLRSGQQFH